MSSSSGQTSFGTTYYVNGMRVSANVALSLLGMGAATQCPGNECSGFGNGRPYVITGFDNQGYQGIGTPCYQSAGGGAWGSRSICGWGAYREFLGDPKFTRYISDSMLQPFLEAYNLPNRE